MRCMIYSSLYSTCMRIYVSFTGRSFFNVHSEMESRQQFSHTKIELNLKINIKSSTSTFSSFIKYSPTVPYLNKYSPSSKVFSSIADEILSKDYSK